MCGIAFAVRPIRSTPDSLVGQDATSSITAGDQSTSLDYEREWTRLSAAVAQRGPDHAETVVVKAQAGRLELRFHATVLHLRGHQVTRQPFQDALTGDIMCWNGEIFDSPSLPVGTDENDGEKLFNLIRTVGFLEAMRRLDGPHAFVYYSRSEGKVYFARDCLGRRSLLKRTRASEGDLVLTSTAPPPQTDVDVQGDAWAEVGCEGIWELDLATMVAQGQESALKLHERFYDSQAPPAGSLLYPFGLLDRSLPTIGSLLPMTRSFPPLPVLSPTYLSLIATFKSLLLESIRQRVLTIPMRSTSTTTGGSKKPRVAILFSGGLDCTSLALLVDEVLPQEEGVDLLNVSFENPRKLQLAGGGGPLPNQKKKKKETKKERQDRLKREENGETEDSEEPNSTPEPPPDTRGQEADSRDTMYDVPDRLTGLATWGELRQLRPHRQWNFVKVDVPYEEMLRHRQTVIELMKPQDTVMDLSIAVAFYFAARGQGTLAEPLSSTSTSRSTCEPPDTRRVPEPYDSTARVLLSGLGADELLGGYSRHRKAYNQYAPASSSSSPPPLPDSPEGHARWTSLIDELQMDLSRIATRNLGRDDRIISSHSKEVRYPFLSTAVVKFLSALPVWHKCDPRFEEGVGDKILLRMLVRDLLSSENEFGGRFTTATAWRLKKRAIHFGARTAKMELDTGKAKGTDRL
ncbi:hypothetical protein JCM3766R1_002474 [Sporobolomyces carnicolor]